MSSNNPFANIPSLMQKQGARTSLIDTIIDAEQNQPNLDDDDEEDVNNETFGADDGVLEQDTSDMPEFFNISVPASQQPAAKANTTATTTTTTTTTTNTTTNTTTTTTTIFATIQITITI